MLKNRSHAQSHQTAVMSQKNDRQPAKAPIVLDAFVKGAIPLFSKVDSTFGERLKAFVMSLPQKVRDFAQQRIVLPAVLSPASLLVAILNWLPPKLQGVANSLRNEAQRFLKNPELLGTKLSLV